MRPLTHVYQFALRRADDTKKQFIIENELIYTEKKLTREMMAEMSEKHKCDIQLTYLGTLTPTKNENIISIEYFNKDMIQQNIEKWNGDQEHAREN